MRIYTFLFVFLTTVLCYAQPSDNAPNPTHALGDVISIFSDAYTDIVTDYDPFWGQAGHGNVNTAFDPGTGNLLLAYPGMNYQGTILTATSAAAMEFLHIDIWVPLAASTRMVKVSPINNGTGSVEVLVEVPLTPGSWNSVDLPKSSFTGMTWDSVFQFKVDAQFNSDGSANTTETIDVYFDNIYFWRAPIAVGTDATLSDLQIDANTISGFDGSKENYFYGSVQGTQTIPQITSVTTTDGNATTLITQASSTTGDATVVVTAQNGTTQKTYTVSMGFSTPSGAAPTPPARNASDVVSLFSDAYSNIGLAELPTDWSALGAFEATTVAGNNVWKLTNCDFLGVVSNYDMGGTDVSSMEKVHIDYWAATNTTNPLMLKIVNTIDNPATEDIESFGTTTTGQWMSVEIPLADFSDTAPGTLADKSKITQFLIDSDGVAPTIFIDNFYFFKGQPLSTDRFEAIGVQLLSTLVDNTIELQTNKQVVGMEVYSILGELVLQNKASTSMTVATLGSGIYLLKVTTEDGVGIEKFMKK